MLAATAEKSIASLSQESASDFSSVAPGMHAAPALESAQRSRWSGRHVEHAADRHVEPPLELKFSVKNKAR